MTGLKMGAIVVVLTAASYASAAELQTPMGAALAAPSGARTASGSRNNLEAIADRDGRAPPARFAATLAGLRPDARAATRGARDAEVYRHASSSVVLVITDTGFGSGVVVGANGEIVTNFHVIDGAETIGVIFKPAVEGAAFGKADVRRARLIKRDELSDLALLQVEDPPKGVKPLAIAPTSALQVGADVHAIGHPDGQSWTYTRGIVSQIRRDYRWVTETEIEHAATVIQTQTPINPGNSGGPLLNDALQVVGINSFVSDGEGLNFAVSGDDLAAFIARPGDRIAQTAKAAKPAARKNKRACEPVDLKTWEDKKEAETSTLVDLDCDGLGDVVYVEPDDKKAPTRVVLDEDGNGKIDAVLFDEDRDGDPDYAIYDTDGDERPDLLGEFKDGEWEPYRWERYDPDAKG